MWQELGESEKGIANATQHTTAGKINKKRALSMSSIAPSNEVYEQTSANVQRFVRAAIPMIDSLIDERVTLLRGNKEWYGFVCDDF